MNAALLAAALLVSGCSLAYRPGDVEFSRELKRVGDGFEEQKQRAIGEANMRAQILAEARDQRAATDRLTNAVNALVDVLAGRGLVRVEPTAPVYSLPPAEPIN